MVIAAYERGTRTPTAANLTMLAAALNREPGEFMGPAGADDSWEYWELICAALPPMTSDQLASAVTILRRIDQRPDPPPSDPHTPAG